MSSAAAIDFNIYWGCHRNTYIKQLPDILRFSNLKQHGQERTYLHGYILDLVIFRDQVNLIDCIPVYSMLSNNFLNSTKYYYRNKLVSAQVISYRKYKSIERDVFLAILERHLLQYWIHGMINIMWCIYIIVHWGHVDEHAPLRKCYEDDSSHGTIRIYNIQRDTENIVSICGLGPVVWS